MTYLFKLAQRTARLRALSLVACAAALSACDADRLTNSSEEPLAPAADPFTPSTPLFNTGFRGGIPFGIWVLPTTEFGPIYNGAQGTSIRASSSVSWRRSRAGAAGWS